MKLRLRVSQIGQAPFEFDHTGPVCNMGRDAACELPFPDKSSGVSWRHARIDLGADGAWLSDLQSSNGTFVNDRRITERVLLKVGDEIRLGKSGPGARVVKVDVAGSGLHERVGPARTAPVVPRELPEPPSSRAPEPTSTPGSSLIKSLLLSASLLVLGGLVAGLGYLVWKQTKQLDVLAQEVRDLGKRTSALEEDAGIDPGADLSLPQGPSTKRVELGEVGPSPRGMLNVLLRPQDKGWQRLKSGEQVWGTDVLTALPGYRSEVHLKSGVRALLWGDLSLHETLPILESRLVLHEPAAGIDLDLTLERGRFVLSNHKDKGEAVIRIRFRDNTWDAHLPDRESAVAIDLRGGYLLGAPVRIDGKGDLPITLLNFATRGKTEIKVLKAPQPGRNADMLTFRLLLRDEADQLWPQLSPWWAGKLEQPEETQKVYQQLLAFLDQAADKPVDQLRKARLASALTPTARVVSVFSLGAVEDLPGVLAALEDSKSAAVREAGLVVLRQWLGRNGDNDRKVRDYLVAKHGFSDARARQAIHWLHGLAESDRTRATAGQLFEGLEDPSLALRQLASWRLSEWLPPPEGKVNYDAAAAPDQRKRAIEQWKAAIPEEFKPASSTKDGASLLGERART